MAYSCFIAELRETIEKMNVELFQSCTKISELEAKVKKQEEENTQLAGDLKECEEKYRASEEKLKFAEQQLAQFSHEPQTSAQESLAQVKEKNDDVLNINSLPNEIIVEVFSYLTQNKLGQIARVCRRWHVLTKSPILWRKVDVNIFCSSCRGKNAVAKSFIGGLPSCVTFIRLELLDFTRLDGDINFEELCMKLHPNCPHVEELILARCAISKILPKVINFCTQFLQNVKKLVFHYCNFDDYSGTVELKDNSKIEILDLYGCDFSHFNNTQFSKLLNLKELRLNKTFVNDTWFIGDTSFLDQLHVLDLGQTTITASTFLAIKRHGHNLKELYLCWVKLQARDLTYNSSVFPHLKTICLFETHVTCQGLVSLIQSCPSLENVYISPYVTMSFAEHPYVLANRCKSRIVKAIGFCHNHNVDY